MDAPSGRRPGSPGRRIVRLVALGAVVGVALMAARFVVHGPVTAESLYSSVAHEADSSTLGDVEKFMGVPERCLPAGSRRWRCEVVDSGQSGTATYDVRVRDGSCWSARLVGEVGEPMPERVNGCVRLAD